MDVELQSVKYKVSRALRYMWMILDWTHECTSTYVYVFHFLCMYPIILDVDHISLADLLKGRPRTT